MRCRLPAMLSATAALATLTLTACTPDQPTDQTLDSFSSALAVIPATEDNLHTIAWTNVSAAADLGAYENSQNPFATAGRLGYGQAAPILSQLDPALLPDEESDGASALWVGRSPDTTFRFDGVDAAAIEEFFAGEDGDRSELAEGTLLVRRDDYEQDFEDELLPAQVLHQMNSVWFGDSTFIGSPAQDLTTSLVEGADDTAAESAVFSGIADCLGDVIAAEATSSSMAEPATSIGVGLGGTLEEPVSTLCVLTEDPAAMAQTIEASLTDGSDPRTGRPWGDILGTGEVAESGDWVQVRFTDPERPDAVLQVVYGGTLPALLGAEVERP